LTTCNLHCSVTCCYCQLLRKMVTADSENVTDNKGVEKSNTEAAQGKESSAFTIEILKVIKEAQQLHGLRHSDYQRYRGYCTRRIARLRKVLHLPQGDKRHFKRKDVTESLLKDDRFLYIPLMLAERAWSYSMQLRQEANTEPRKKYHLVNKLKKAVTYAQQLHALCQTDLCDARSKLEAQAYLCWMQGSMYFEVRKWGEAMENLQQAKIVYERLCGAVNEEDQIVYKHKCDELIPSLRYCAYSIGEETDISDLKSLRGIAQDDVLEKLDQLILEAQNKEGGNVQEIDWRGMKIPVRPNVVGSFLMSEKEMPANEKNLDALERHIIHCKDAMAAVRDEINNDPHIKTKPKGTMTPMHYLLSYLTHIRLVRSNQRTLLMIEGVKASLDSKQEENQKSKPQDIIRLYEMVLQNFNELQQLPGLENDIEYQKDIEVSITAYKSFRCYYVADVLAGTKKFRESHALFDRALSYAEIKSSPKIGSTLRKDLEELEQKIQAARSSCLAQAVLQGSDGSVDAPATSKSALSKIPLAERLGEYFEDPKLTTKQANIIKLPPDMKPIPAKPLFFDVAMNHVTFPAIEDKSEKKSNPTSISGFVKGFLGWGGSK